MFCSIYFCLILVGNHDILTNRGVIHTERLWILFIFIFSFLKGTREGMKKAALKKSSATEILFFYTLIGFLLTIPFSAYAFTLSPAMIFFILLKALAVCIAWLCTFSALKKMSVSLYGITDLSRMIFSVLLGVFILGEAFTTKKAIGIVLVLAGLLLVNLKKTSETKGITALTLFTVLSSCFFNALSGIMDKILMRYMISSQLQFWFMLFMTIIYGIILFIKKEKISVRSIKTNYWIPIMSIALIVGDRLLFEANASPFSEVTLMTIIKQSSVLVTVLTGWLIFKEKHIFYKLFCTAIILCGIFVAIL